MMHFWKRIEGWLLERRGVTSSNSAMRSPSPKRRFRCLNFPVNSVAFDNARIVWAKAGHSKSTSLPFELGLVLHTSMPLTRQQRIFAPGALPPCRHRNDIFAVPQVTLYLPVRGRGKNEPDNERDFVYLHDQRVKTENLSATMRSIHRETLTRPRKDGGCGQV